MYFDQKEFGKRVSERRTAINMTQEQLALILGVNKQHISRIERGVNAVSIDLLVEISEALNISTDFLLKGKSTEEDDVKAKLESVKEQLLAITLAM